MRTKLLLLLLAIILGLTPVLAYGQGRDNRLVHAGLVAAPVKDVWTAFTTKEGQESWMTAHSEIELKVGGLMRTNYDPKGTVGDPKTIENMIISYDPERMLSIKVTKAPEGFPFPNAITS